MKDKPSLLMLIGKPDKKGKKEESDDSDDDMKLSAMKDFISAVKSGNASDALDAYHDLCDMHEMEGGDSEEY